MDTDTSGSRRRRRFAAPFAALLSEDDVIMAAEAIEPGSTAALLVWENLWVAPFGASVRHAGGQLVASGRIPVQALAAAIEADAVAADTGTGA